MKKYLFFFTIIFGAIMLMNSSSKTGFFPYEYKTETLENGLRVILIKMPSNGLVSYYTIVRTGSRDEYEPGHTGFAHFFEHMMFRGTKKYPGNVYDRILTEMGSDGNAYTTDDYTCYHLNFTSDNLEKVMDLESDRFQNLWYPEQDFQTEAGAVYGEYRKGKASPFFWIWEALCNTAFEKHTYKHTTIGFEEDIKAMPQMYEYS
ncbi:MAG: M16 family metallopeptidase, partial [Candidatus Kapaibacteriota bacterium]